VKSRGRKAVEAAVIAVGAILGLVVAVPVALVGAGLYHSYYVASESMMPTLLKNDRLIARVGGAGDLRRGDILLFSVGGDTYIQRLAALPGDRIAMKKGVVVLNGRPVPQRFLRRENYAVEGGPPLVSRLSERFPGEARDHEVYDVEASAVDDMPEVRIPAGFFFTLGDNRDRSADSRVPREEAGVALLPASDILGHAAFYSWGSSRPLGRKLSD
jgi:signal peptidase I